MNLSSNVGHGILIVIPCLNEEANIASVVRGALDAAVPDTLVVVADGGSSDGTRQILSDIAAAETRLRLMDNPLRIQSAGVNRAVELLGRNKRWLVRMDAHATYPPDFLPKLIAEAERTLAASVVVSMDSRGETCFQKAAAAAQNTFLGAGGSPHRTAGAEGYVDHGHHALFDMNAFRAVGGYDQAQSHNEDAELDVRLVRSGYRIWLTRATNLVYHPRARAGSLFRQYRNYGRGRATTILRHRVRPKLRQILPASVVPSIAALMLVPWSPIAALPLALWLCSSIAFGVVLGLRSRERCAFASGFAAIVMHLAWSLGFWGAVLSAPSRAAAGWRTQPQ